MNGYNNCDYNENNDWDYNTERGVNIDEINEKINFNNINVSKCRKFAYARICPICHNDKFKLYIRLENGWVGCSNCKNKGFNIKGYLTTDNLNRCLNAVNVEQQRQNIPVFTHNYKG